MNASVMGSGGKRTGAGRPRIDSDATRKVVSFRVAPETKERINILRWRGYSVGRLFDEFIERYFKDTEK